MNFPTQGGTHMAAGAPPPGQCGSLQPARRSPTRPPLTRNPPGKAPLAPGSRWLLTRPTAPPAGPAAAASLPLSPAPSRSHRAAPAERKCAGPRRAFIPAAVTSARRPARGARREAPALPGRWRPGEGNLVWNFLVLLAREGTRPHAFLFLPHEPQPPGPRP